MKLNTKKQKIPILKDIVDKNLLTSAETRSKSHVPQIDARPNSAAIEMIVNRVLLKYLPKIRQELIAELSQLNIKEKPSE